MNGATQRKKDFYERNKGNPVNLFTRTSTLSGDVGEYDRDLGILRLENTIQRIYNSDGTSEFVEVPEDFEIDVGIVNARVVSTREDRLGRIIKYNEDLVKSEESSINGSTLESPQDKDSKK